MTWDLFPEEPGPAMEQAPAPGPESSTPESFDAGIEWASFVGGTSGGGDDPGKDAGVEPATEAEAAYQTDPAASFDVAPERPWDVPVSGDDPDLLGDSLAAIEPPASGRVPDESWFAESSGGPAEVPPAGGEEYAIGPDLSGYAGVSPPPVAPDGTAGATHAAEMLEAVARMVRSGEIVVSATPGATAESVLASILASLLSPPS